MIKRKFKNLTTPAIYLAALFVFSASIYAAQSLVNKDTFQDKNNNNMEYVDKEIVSDEIYIPVVVQTNIIQKPFLNETIKVNKTFYDKSAENETQENSIIFYENTYMQNTGISYQHQEKFEIIAILDGTVIEVTDNEILGKTIKIKHDNDLISTYQSLSETNVNVNDNVARGQIIGASGICKLYTTDHNLHFELNYQGKNVNPEEYYNKSTDEL